MNALETAAATLANRTDNLGTVVWFSVFDVRIDPATLAAIAGKCGIGDPPALGHPADAFRRATTNRQTRNAEAGYRLLTRPVVDDSEKIVRHVIAERVDRHAARLGHTHVGTMTYYKAADSMVCATAPGIADLPSAVAADVAAMLDGAYADFQQFRRSLTGPEITRYLMRRLDGLSRITVDPRGGVYFVPAGTEQHVEALRSLVRELKAYVVDPAADHTFYAVPVPATGDQREMVAAGFRKSIAGEIDAMVADVAAYLSADSKKPLQCAVEHRITAIAAMRAKAEAYLKMLGEESGECLGRIALLEAQAEALLDKATGKTADPMVAALAAFAERFAAATGDLRIKFVAKPDGSGLLTRGASDLIEVQPSATKGWIIRAATGHAGRRWDTLAVAERPTFKCTARRRLRLQWTEPTADGARLVLAALADALTGGAIPAPVAA